MSTVISIENNSTSLRILILACLWKNTSYIGPEGLKLKDKAFGFYLRQPFSKISMIYAIGFENQSVFIDVLNDETIKVYFDTNNNTVDVTLYDQYHGEGSGKKCVEKAINYYKTKFEGLPLMYRMVHEFAGCYEYGPWYTSLDKIPNFPESPFIKRIIQFDYPMRGDQIITN